MLNKTTYKDLIVWQKAMELVVAVYKLTSKYPDEEKFGIISQSRRCSISIPSNIAEGCGRNSDADLNRFMDIANGSAFELETLLILSFDLDYISQEEFQYFDKKMNEIQKMIFGFKQTLIRN